MRLYVLNHNLEGFLGTVLRQLEESRTPRLLTFVDPPSRLRAFLAIDNLTLGPSAGGIRTLAYPSASVAVKDVLHLARTMTIKCSLAGVNAGGAKMVVMVREGLDRVAAFRFLGDRVEELNGLFTTAGDLGTTAEDLEAMAARTRYVRTDNSVLGKAVAKGIVGCIRSCAERRGGKLAGLRVAVQGCGLIGSTVARSLAHNGVTVLVADINPERAAQVNGAIGARVVAPDRILYADVDVVAPCAVGGVLDVRAASDIRAWAVCGAANNILADHNAARLLVEREIIFVPDPIASAGAVIAGLQLPGSTPSADELLEQLPITAARVLDEAESSGQLPSKVAEEHAWARIHAAAADPMVNV